MKEGKIMNTAILIPAFEPDEKLINLIHDLSNLLFPFTYITVVDDGSSMKCIDIDPLTSSS